MQVSVRAQGGGSTGSAVGNATLVDAASGRTSGNLSLRQAAVGGSSSSGADGGSATSSLIARNAGGGSIDAIADAFGGPASGGGSGGSATASVDALGANTSAVRGEANALGRSNDSHAAAVAEGFGPTTALATATSQFQGIATAQATATTRSLLSDPTWGVASGRAVGMGTGGLATASAFSQEIRAIAQAEVVGEAISVASLEGTPGPLVPGDANVAVSAVAAPAQATLPAAAPFVGQGDAILAWAALAFAAPASATADEVILLETEIELERLPDLSAFPDLDLVALSPTGQLLGTQLQLTFEIGGQVVLDLNTTDEQALDGQVFSFDRSALPPSSDSTARLRATLFAEDPTTAFGLEFLLIAGVPEPRTTVLLMTILVVAAVFRTRTRR